MSENSPDPAAPKPPTPDKPTTPKRGPVKRTSRPITSNPQPRRIGFLSISILLIALVLIVIIAALFAGSEGSSALLQRLGIPSADVSRVIWGFINTIYFFAGTLAVISLLIGGFRTATSLGDPREAKRGRRTLFSSLAVLTILIITYIIFYQILRAPDAKAPPVASLEITVSPNGANEGSVPHRVLFDVISSYPNTVNYVWDFGDGTTATTKTAQHEFQKPGDFKVKVTAREAGVDMSTATTEIKVDAVKPSPEITVVPNPAQGQAPLKVIFSAERSRPGTGAGEEMDIQWDFGDPSASEGNENNSDKTRVEHEYFKAGTFTATLTVTDDQGKTNSTTVDISVTAEKEEPVARIITSPGLSDPIDPEDPASYPYVEVVAPSEMSFSGATSESPNGKIVRYEWNFGDGSGVKSGRSATHNFNKVGKYLVELVIIDEYDKKASSYATVIVSPPQKAPVAKIETIPPGNNNSIIGEAPLKISFSGRGSVDEDGSVIAYKWDFGDGDTADGEKVDHIFLREGQYFVKLIVTDDSEKQSEPVSFLVKATKPKEQKPIAAIVSTPKAATGTVPFALELDGSASYDPGGSIINYAWDFGDNSPVVNAGAKVTHIYTKSGIFTAKLTITDNDGTTATTTMAVATREPDPMAKIEVNKTLAQTDEPVTFNGSSSMGNVQSWNWNFDDGTAESGREVEHKFDNPGYYKVKLTITDVNNQTSQAEITIEIN